MLRNLCAWVLILFAALLPTTLTFVEANFPAPVKEPQPEISKNATAPAKLSRFARRTVRTLHVPAGDKVIALTFDDGPWELGTPRTLAILQKYKARATFFVIGKYAKRHPELIRQAHKSGHEIGNHSWSHRYKRITPEELVKEVDGTSELIEQLTGETAFTFRPPGAVLNNGMTVRAKAKGYPIILWSVNSGDTSPKATSTSMIQNVLSHAFSGAIVLMHDGAGKQAEKAKALPKILKELTRRGYRFVTISELLEIANAPKKPVVPRVRLSPRATPKRLR